MSFEMSLPHAPRIQQLAADGAEQVAQDEQAWELYYTVQRALQQSEAGTAADMGDGTQEQAGGTAGQAAATKKASQPSDPQKVLEKLLTARGELDVITDLITFVEQQQFLSVEGIHRHPPSLEERLRARSLRLATSRQQLRGAGERLHKGLAALQAQSQVDNRFLSDLSHLRQRWKLRRHVGGGGAAGLFYADIGLPLWGSAAQGITQEGAHCNIIQDTNGDACIVEAAAPGGKRRVVRGWRHIHAVLEAKQQLLTWRVLQQAVAAQAQQARHEADPDGAVAAVQRLAAAAVAACQAELYQAVASSGSGSGREAAERAAAADAAAGAGDPAMGAAMEVDHADAPSGSRDGGGEAANGSNSAAPHQAAAAAALSSSLLMTSAALDIQAALQLPGFQRQFEARALLLLSQQMVGGGSSSGGRCGSVTGGELLEGLLLWLHHAALRRRVGASLQGWAAAAGGRELRRVESHEEFTAVWQLLGSCSSSRVVPVLVVVHGASVQVEGVTAAAAAATSQHPQQRGLSKAQLEALLQRL